MWVQRRSDLDGPYGGWQALDSTPQELSGFSETMVVGPAPVHVSLHYRLPDIFGND